MPAKKLFALGVGHTRRKQILPGSRSEDPGRVIDTEIIPLTSEQWKIMEVLKREFAVSELVQDLWQQRADEIGITLQELYDTADELESKGLIGRFSTFLEHVKPTADGERVTRYNALFHWAPIADELKELDKEIVINSIKNKWMLVVSDFEKIPVNLK